MDVNKTMPLDELVSLATWFQCKQNSDRERNVSSFQHHHTVCFWKIVGSFERKESEERSLLPIRGEIR